jgi:diguanylate cyclase (GGDEF)-like protein/PAS domain S-box-containing protein
MENNTPVILVVDDDEDLNRLMRKTIQREGFSAEGVLNGEDALQRIARDPRLILLLDYELKDMTGRDIIESLRKRGLDIPFVVATGQGDEERAVEMMKLGARDYLLKGAGLIKVLPHSIKKIINALEFERKYKESQQMLGESEKKFRALFNQASDSIFIMIISDGVPIIEDVNEAALRLHGYTRDELIGKPISFLDDPESRQHVPERTAKLMAGEPVKFEVTHLRNDGTVFPLEVSAQMVEIGGKQYIIAIDRDFSERKSAELKLRASEEKYRNLIDSLQEGIWALDKDDNTTFVNKRMAEMLGYSIGEMIGKKVFSFMDEQGVELCKKRIELRKQGVKEQHDFELLRKDGSRLYVTMEASPIMDDAGNYIGGVAGVIDVSERRRVEEELLDAGEKLKRTFDSISDMVSLHDRNFRIVRVNKAMSDFFGKEPEELIGRYCYELFHNTKEPWPDCPHRRAMDSKRPVTADVNDPHIGCALEISASPVFDKEGNVMETVHIAKDISIRKRSEMALKESERRYRELIASLPEAIVVWQGGEIVYVNNSGIELFGAARPAQIIGNTADVIMHPDSSESIKKHITGSLNSGHPFSLSEVKMLRLDRSAFDADISGAPATFFGRPASQIVVRDITLRKRAEDELMKSRMELSVLYSVSSAISRTIDMKELADIILDTITGIGMFETHRKGGIFIIEDDRMELVAHLGHSAEFLSLHNNMRVGDCLCGLSAESGEIIISTDAHHDDRHSIRYPEMSSHGHIIIPLKTKEKVMGVLYLYLSSDFVIEESRIKLLETIGGQLGVAIENARLYEETKRFSLHDPLTGLANRRYIDIVLERNFAAAKRFKKPFAIIMADIDHFKNYNDTYGHIAGDRMLINVAKILEKETREVDLISRYGGEEFLILLSEADIDRARSVAEHKRKAVAEAAGITISLGVASYNDKINKPEELIKHADKALYQAKQNGRNRVEAYG